MEEQLEDQKIDRMGLAQLVQSIPFFKREGHWFESKQSGESEAIQYRPPNTIQGFTF